MRRSRSPASSCCTASGRDSSDWDVWAFKAKLHPQSGTRCFRPEVCTAKQQGVLARAGYLHQSLLEHRQVKARQAESRLIKWRIPNWRRFLPYVGGIAALLLFAAALVILYGHAQAYRPSEVRRALRTLQAWQPFAALGLAAASYLLLTLYDVLALRHIGRTLPYRRVALASFAGYAFSHTLGFGSVIGPSIRYRVYTTLGST